MPQLKGDSSNKEIAKGCWHASIHSMDTWNSERRAQKEANFKFEVRMHRQNSLGQNHRFSDGGIISQRSTTFGSCFGL